jgi:hypothetical protein
MRKLAISKNSIAYSEGRQAFHAGLDILDDNPYNVKNAFGALPLTWFEFHDGFEEEYQKAQKALDDQT